MKRKKVLFILVCVLLLSACGSRTEEAAGEEDAKDSVLRSCVDWKYIGTFRSMFFKMEYARNDIWWRMNLPSILNGITDKDIVMYGSKGEPVKIYRCSFRINEIGDLIDIEIHYPRIAHDLDRAEIINVQIYENLITEDIWAWHNQRFNLFYDYQIKYAQDGILSVLFKGDSCWGMNFDLETGEQLKLDQFVSPEEILRLIEDEQTEIDGMDREELNELVEEKIRFNSDINDFFIWEKGIGFPVWLEDRLYILVYIDMDGKRIDCNEINHTIFVKESDRFSCC